MNRRSILATGGLSIVAGCLAGSQPGHGTAERGNGTWEYETSDVAPALSSGGVAHDDHSLVLHVTSAERAAETFTYEKLTDDGEETARTFVDETRFESETLFYVETRAPNPCYDCRIRSLELTDERVLVGGVKSIDTSGEDELCPQAESAVSRLVRVTGDPPPTRARLEITDGWGETEEATSVSPDEL